MLNFIKESAYECVCLTIGAGFSISFIYVLKVGRKMIHNLENIPEVIIEKPLQKLLKETTDGLEACTWGEIVAEHQTLHSIENPKITGVIWKHTIEEHIIAQIFGVWSREKRKIGESIRNVPFHVINNKTRVKIWDPLQLDDFDLTTVSEKFIPTNNSFGDHLWGFVKGIQTTGTQYKEEMLLQGTKVLAIGKFVVDKGVICLKPSPNLPYILTTRNKESLIRDYESSTSMFKILSVISTCITSYFLYRISIKAYKYWRQYRREQEDIQTIQAIQDARSNNNRDLPESLMCLVCCDLRDIIIRPCKHICICGECYLKLDPKICPVCRCVVESIEPVFYS